MDVSEPQVESASSSPPPRSDILDELDIVPARGCLQALRTKAEVQASDETIDVYVCAIPLKQAGSILKTIKTIPGQDSPNLHHLRRVVKNGYLPESLEREIVQSKRTSGIPEKIAAINGLPETHNDLIIQTNGGEAETEAASAEVKETIYVLICPTGHISRSDISTLLAAALKPPSRTIDASPTSPAIYTLAVPLHPPTSPAHSFSQSRALWPTLYNPNTSYGPSPSVLLRAQQELEEGEATGYYMALAHLAGREARLMGHGEGIGVVVVERIGGIGKVVCVAGDGRFIRRHKSVEHNNKPQDTEIAGPSTPFIQDSQTGDPAYHAVMRAITLIALKRREIASTTTTAAIDIDPEFSTHGYLSTSRADLPLTTLESRTHSVSALQPGGYLCLNLEFFITHEPCIMCSMALVHSRVGRVVFGCCIPSPIPTITPSPPLPQHPPTDSVLTQDRRRKTGALKVTGSTGEAVDGEESGYGLCWREDLNWRFMCWEWVWGGEGGGEFGEYGDLVCGDDVCV